MYALLSDPKFVVQHLQRAILKNPNLLLKLDSKLFCVDDDELSKARRLSLPSALSLDKVEISGSCNGLLCISDQQNNEDIFLFNRSTGVFKNLPFPGFDIPTLESCFSTLGFGYLQAEYDYKVIRCVYLYDKPFVDIDSYECEARIYSLNADKWKDIGHIPFHLGYKAALWLGNEYLVWKATRGPGIRGSYLVVSYDMKKEEFKEIPQPDVSYPNGIHMEVSVLDALLSIFYLSRDDGIHIWSMKDYGVKESWALRFVIHRPDIVEGYNYMFLKPLTVLENGEILIEAGEKARILYDPKNEIFRMINAIRGAPRRFLVTPLVGSLVSKRNKFD